ncbi:MAG: hypothetical protein HY744_06745, partial [Deltaproteobacteria bacterium]|nr:hypothetical protein [Deltaproteobacteria bacterium]
MRLGCSSRAARLPLVPHPRPLPALLCLLTLLLVSGCGSDDGDHAGGTGAGA